MYHEKYMGEIQFMYGILYAYICWNSKGYKLFLEAEEKNKKQYESCILFHLLKEDHSKHLLNKPSKYS